MKSWQEMKDFSYVGIKITKAKSISQGLTKCKIEKLTRQNPVYEHLKVHKLMEGKKDCNLCASLHQIKYYRPKIVVKSKKSFNSVANIKPQNKTQYSQETSTCVLKRNAKNNYTSLQKLNQAQNNFQSQAYNNFDKFQQVIQKFDDSVRRTKSQFLKMKNHSKSINTYFLTEADEIDHQINQDRNLQVAHVKSDRMNMIQQHQREKYRLRQAKKKVRALNQPIKFPLKTNQIIAIIKQSQQKQKDQSSKLNKMLHSLYQYKSKTSYSNKMNLIKRYAQN